MVGILGRLENGVILAQILENDKTRVFTPFWRCELAVTILGVRPYRRRFRHGPPVRVGGCRCEHRGGGEI